MPLKELWKGSNKLDASRIKYLTKEAIVEILRNSSVEFVVANTGDTLKWIPISQCFNYWKKDFKHHVTDNLEKIFLEDYPDGLAYVASLWKHESSNPIILLEAHH